MNALKRIFTILLLLLILIGGWVVVYYDHIQRFPTILPSFYSKEMCSCLYVLKRSEENCHVHASISFLKISDFRHDTENKQVIVTGLGRTVSASFVSERYGCILD